MRKLAIRALLVTAVLVSTAVSAADGADLVSQAEAARATAMEADAPLLAPDNFADGERALERARADAARGRNDDKVTRWAGEALSAFERAADAAARAASGLGSALRARAAASEAGAGTLDLDDWRRGESELEKAALALERGDESAGLRRGEAAADRYRSAELQSIKLRLLADTRALIEDARRQKVQRYAPRTLARAEALVSEAEAAIEADRYDTDKPRELALQARYEVRHAFQIARQVDAWQDRDGTPEDLILEMEEPMRRVAAQADVPIRFDEGPDATAEQLLDHMDALEDQNQRLGETLEERTSQVFALEEEITATREQLGGVAQQREALQQQVRRQEMERQRLDQVEALFQRDEARVFRQGQQVILRLSGLTFAPGSAEIPAGSADLMKRLETAIRLFPDAEVTVTGHTDSFGSDSGNFELSRRRAEAVRRYLVETAKMPSFRISAVGYGETQPVASNATEEGRARNRRIDVFINPAD